MSHATPEDFVALPPALERAYRATVYRVCATGGDISLRVDEPSGDLASLLEAAGTSTAALLTAWNPHGERVPDAQNAAAQQALLQHLEACGLRSVPARNEPLATAHASDWSEDSVLVAGLARDEAIALSRRHGQLALLWIGNDATPRLIAVAPAHPGP